MSKYYDWDSFKNIYLEDSFVLGIEESDNQMSFIVEMVLTENHPMYSSRHKDEQYCYKKGKIIFQDVKSVKWLNKNTRPFTDANCRVPCDYIPKRSYPLFRTRQILNDWLTQNLEEA